MKHLMTTMALLLCASIATAAQVEGTWTATAREDRLALSLQYGVGSQTSISIRNGAALRVSDVSGLEPGSTASAQPRAVEFSLAREAGTIHFTGVFREGKGFGDFIFTPAENFGTRLAAAGVRMSGTALEAKKQLLMHAFDVSTGEIAEMRSLGYDGMRLDEVISNAIFRVTPEMVREFQRAGYRDLPLSTLTSLRIHKVTLDYLRQLEELRLGTISLDKAVTMRIHGVTPEFVRELRSLGYTDLTADELVEMRIFRVTPQLIRDLAAAGYHDIPVRKLIQIRIHGVEDALLKRKM